MRDFNWTDELYCVVKENGTFAGVPCRTIEEAIDLATQHDKSAIFEMKFNGTLKAIKTDEYMSRINTIAQICAELEVPYTTNKLWEGWQIRFPWCVGDVACHNGTYGHNDGMVESYQFPWDDEDVSVLTPEEAGALIVKYYNETVGK